MTVISVFRQTITVPGVASAFIQSYKYDPLNRLTEAWETSASALNWRQTFSYDPYGNRTGFSYLIGQTPVTPNQPAIDPLTNRFQASQGYEYDLNGNLIQDPAGTQYLFDGDNRQRGMQNDNPLSVANEKPSLRNRPSTLIVPPPTASYSYDGSGRRGSRRRSRARTRRPFLFTIWPANL